MGFTTVSKLEIIRDRVGEKITVRWWCDVLGERRRDFKADEIDAAIQFAASELKALAM